MRGVIRISAMRLIWCIYTETKSKEKAGRLLKKIAELLEVELGATSIQKNDKGGCSCVFSHKLNCAGWGDNAYECLRFAQRIGYSWNLYGDIEEEVDIWSEKIKLPGIVSIHGTCTKNV